MPSVGHRLKLLDARAALLQASESEVPPVATPGSGSPPPSHTVATTATSSTTTPSAASPTLYAGAGSPDSGAAGWGAVTEARFYDVILPQVMARRGTPWPADGGLGPEVTPRDYLEQHEGHVTGACAVGGGVLWCVRVRALRVRGRASRTVGEGPSRSAHQATCLC